MQPRITVITLGVDGLERAVRFCSSPGFPSEGIVGALGIDPSLPVTVPARPSRGLRR